MPNPPAYNQTTDFSNDESNNVSGRSTVRTSNLDTEFVNIEATIDQIVANLALSQASDGTPKDDWVDLPSLADDVINYIQTNGQGWFASDTGAVNDMVVTLDPAPTSLTNGMFVVTDIKLTNTSTAVTLNVNGLGAKAIVLDGAGSLPSVGQLTIGTFYGFQYDSRADKFQTVFSGDSLTQSASAAASATAAANSATASANSATAAATSYDNFDDRFLGAKDTSSGFPTVDNDGDALIDGCLLFSTTDNVMFVYDLGNTTWVRTTPTTSDQAKINTVSGIASDVTAVAGVSTQVGLLGTADAISDMNTLGTADVVADMNTLATADVVADLNTLGTADVVADMNTLATADIVADMNTLATSANVTAMGHLGTSANVTAMGLLGTSAVVTDMGILGTADVVADLNTLGSADVVSDLNTLATADVVADMNTLATADVVNDMNVPGTSANVTAMNTLGTSANVTAMSNCSGSIANINTTATNIADVNNFANTYRIASSDPSSSLDEGDLVFRTDTNAMRVYNGSAWQNVAPTATAMAFGTVAVSGQSDVEADSTSDTLTLAGAGGVPVTTNAGTATVTISSTAENAFKTLAVSGQSDIVADSTTDTLTFATGDSSTLTIATNAGTDTMTFTGIDNSVPMAIALG